MPTTTNYIWDEQNYLAESDGTNTINVVYTNEPQQYGNLVSTRISSSTSYHYFDAIGSTRQLTNDAGAVTDKVIYDAWGNVVNRKGATAVAMLWIAQIEYYSDPETGLIYILARIIGPKIGRWTSTDPAFFQDGLNRYSYVLNSPLTNLDPSGRQTSPDLPLARDVTNSLSLALIPNPAPPDLPPLPKLPRAKPKLRGSCLKVDDYVSPYIGCQDGYEAVPYKIDGVVVAIWCIKCQSRAGKDQCRVVDDRTGKIICGGSCNGIIADLPPFPPSADCQCSFPPPKIELF